MPPPEQLHGQEPERHESEARPTKKPPTMEDEAREVMFPMGQRAPTRAGETTASRVLVPGLGATGIRISELPASSFTAWLDAEQKIARGTRARYLS